MTEKISGIEVRKGYSLVGLLSGMGLKQIPGLQFSSKVSPRTRYFQCPFHPAPPMVDEDDEWAHFGRAYELHPFRISDDLHFDCTICRRHGNGEKLVELLTHKPGELLDSLKKIGRNSKPAPKLSLPRPIELLKEYLEGDRLGPDSDLLLIEASPEKVGDRFSWQDLHPAGSDMAEAASALQEFAVQKRWIFETAEGQVPLEVVEQTVNGIKCPTIAFPKRLMTARSRRIYGKDDVIIASKYRVSPEYTLAAGNFDREVKWVAETGYDVSAPFEFDAHEDADVLFIIIGPGSALRLHNELNANKESHERFGVRSHVVGFDSLFNLAPSELLQHAVGSDGMNLFGGYKKVIVLLDDHFHSSAHAPMIEATSRLLKVLSSEDAAVKNVQLPGAGIGSYFRDGGSLGSLARLCHSTPEV